MLADELPDNRARVAQRTRVEGTVRDWIATLPAADALSRLEAARVPCSTIFDASDIAADAHYRARGAFETVDVGGPLAIPAVAPKLDDTPGRTTWPGPDVGAHTDDVLRRELGMSDAAIAQLRDAGVIR